MVGKMLTTNHKGKISLAKETKYLTPNFANTSTSLLPKRGNQQKENLDSTKVSIIYANTNQTIAILFLSWFFHDLTIIAQLSSTKR